jgi:hypothetical protein
VEEDAWKPLAKLIGKIQHLTDLIFDVQAPLDSCLLESLHESHPQCRLDIRCFRYKSLYQPVTDPHDLALATSPCLHAITVPLLQRAVSVPDYNLPAVMRTVAGLAPNLRSVKLVTCTHQQRVAATTQAQHGQPPAQWPGFTLGPDSPPGPLPQRRGTLESLHISWPILPRDLTGLLGRWTSITDFTRLRNLELMTVILAASFYSLANKIDFGQLQELAVDFGPGLHNTNALPKRFPGLVSLNLTGDIREDLLQIIAEEGLPNLTNLILSPRNDLTRRGTVSSLGPTVLRELSEGCPKLQALTLPIRRRKNEAEEGAMYEALREFKCLAVLRVVVDTTPCQLEMRYARPALSAFKRPQIPYDQFDAEWYDEDRSICKGDVREHLMDAAVDEKLDRDIWNVISVGKTGCKLQKLHIVSHGGIKCSNAEQTTKLKQIVAEIGRSFLLQRSVRDDSDL